jgi:hypothetical protein
VIRLDDTGLVWPEFLQLDLKELVLLARQSFLVQNEYIGNVILMNL